MEFEVKIFGNKTTDSYMATLEMESPMSDFIKGEFIKLNKAYEEIVNSNEFSFEIFPIDDEAERFVALMQHLDLGFDSFNDFEFDDRNTFILGNKEYKVLTDNEADNAYEECLDNYIEEIILSEIPERYHSYFDTEKWKDDARCDDSRGNELASYDGIENEEMVNVRIYYIYRTI